MKIFILFFLFLLGVCDLTFSATEESFRWSDLSSGEEEEVKLPTSLVKIPETRLVPTGPNYKLTEEDVHKWFEQVASPSFLDSHLVHSQCFSVSELKNDRGQPMQGGAADQVFFISIGSHCPGWAGSSRPLFVLKHYKSGPNVYQEIDQLLALKKDFSTLRFRRNMPRIVFSEFFYKYPNPDRKRQLEKSVDEDRYISLIHPAQGKSLWSMLEGYVKEENVAQKGVEKQELLKACSRLGTVLAHFHLNFMRGKGCPYRKYSYKLRGTPEDIRSCYTQTHGDLHFKNVFWDGKNIYFIDIATLSNAPHDLNFIEELSYTFAMLVGFTDNLFSRRSEKEQTARGVLISDVYSGFLKAYLKVYKEKETREKYKQLVDFLKENWILKMEMMMLGSKGAGDIAGSAWARIAEEL